MAIHSREEYVSVQDMEKAVEILVFLSARWAKAPAIKQTT
jgi:di/tripeptidase